jgi:hypothetical protein
MSRQALRSIGVTLMVLTAASMGLPAGHRSTIYPIADAPAEMRPAILRADMAIIDLQGAVLRELSQKVRRDGPAAALKSCHLWSLAEAMRLQRQEGIVAGRTSDRLRNPANAPRAWAAPIVERYAGRRHADVDGFVVELDGRVGVMRPIHLLASCETCHGPVEALDRDVRAQLKERYPTDRAVGYRKGDLRGWFWIEVPMKGP